MSLESRGGEHVLLYRAVGLTSGGMGGGRGNGRTYGAMCVEVVPCESIYGKTNVEFDTHGRERRVE